MCDVAVSLAQPVVTPDSGISGTVSVRVAKKSFEIAALVLQVERRVMWMLKRTKNDLVFGRRPPQPSDPEGSFEDRVILSTVQLAEPGELRLGQHDYEFALPVGQDLLSAPSVNISLEFMQHVVISYCLRAYAEREGWIGCSTPVSTASFCVPHTMRAPAPRLLSFRSPQTGTQLRVICSKDVVRMDADVIHIDVEVTHPNLDRPEELRAVTGVCITLEGVIDCGSSDAVYERIKKTVYRTPSEQDENRSLYNIDYEIDGLAWPTFLAQFDKNRCLAFYELYVSPEVDMHADPKPPGNTVRLTAFDPRQEAVPEYPVPLPKLPEQLTQVARPVAKPLPPGFTPTPRVCDDCILQ